MIDRIIGRIYATYGCNPGYNLSGSSIRECDVSRGQWVGPAPTCEECELSMCLKLTVLLLVIPSTVLVRLQQMWIVDILGMLNMEQWMSLKELN